MSIHASDELSSRSTEELLREIDRLKAENSRLKNKPGSGGLSSENDFLKTVIDSLEHPFYVLDAGNYEVVLANSAAGALEGIPCYTQLHHQDQPCHEHGEDCPLKAVSQSKKAIVVEHVHIDGEGGESHVEVHAHPIFDSSGRVRQIIEYTLDVTEKKRVFEEANSLANVIRQSTDSIVLTDLEGNIKYVNPMFEKITGYTFDEVKGKNPSILKSKNAKYPPDHYRKLWKTILNGGVWEGEFLNTKKNGEDYVEEASIFPVRDQDTGKVICYGAVKKDVTLPRVLEEKLKKSYEEVVSLKEKAEAANRLKSQFLAHMSHDIRTPLHGIMGFADLLLKREQRAEEQGYLEKIKISGKGLLNLIDDILDLSKIEAGQLDIYKRSFHIKDLTDTLAGIFAIQFEQKNIGFALDLSAAVPAVMFNDRWRINQVLTNLLSNALKFTEKGAVAVRVDYDNAGDRVIFTVKDSGVGIAEEYQRQIFDPFSQVQHTGDFETKGTGLGLAICKNLVSLMGGDIAVSSSPGEGSEFTVEIPADRGKVESEAVPRDLEAQPELKLEDKRGNKILIAEDNPVSRELIVEQFKEMGFHSLLLAANGREAVDMALEYSPDLVLMDQQMPVLDGIQAIAELKQKGYQGPVVILSAFAMREDIDEGLNAGAVGYITKPIDFDKFFLQIGKFLKETGTDAYMAGKLSPFDDRGGLGKDDEYRIKEGVSAKVRNVFLSDAHEKLAVLKEALEGDDFENKKSLLKRIAHGYKGNTAYFGLWALETAARELDQAFIDQAPTERLLTRTREVAEILAKILETNKPV
jgi:PAS domain S-box-containing protein